MLNLFKKLAFSYYVTNNSVSCKGLTLSLAGNNEAKLILQSFVVRIAEQTELFDAMVDDLHKKYPTIKPEKEAEGLPCKLFWDNKMYLSLTALLQKVDTISIELKALKAADAMPGKLFREYQHNVTGRFRNIMDCIYTSCKQNNKMMYPSKAVGLETA